MLRLWLDLNALLLLTLAAPAGVFASAGSTGPCAVLSVSSQGVNGHAFAAAICRDTMDADHLILTSKPIRLGDVLTFVPCPLEGASCFVEIIDSPDTQEVQRENAESGN